MKKNLTIVFFVFSTLIAWGQNKLITIKGNISDGNRIIEDVNISVQGSDTGTLTDENGAYKLSVPEGSRLRYTHVGYEPVEIIIEDLDRTLNIIMVPKINQLDAVTVTKIKPRKTQKELFQEYNTNPNLIKTMFGILDKETVGFSMRTLDAKDLKIWYPDLSYLLNNRFASLSCVCNPYTQLLITKMRPTATLGNAGPINSIYEVDGMIYEQLPCNFVDVSNIERIAVIPSFSGLTKYGTLAKGGIVIINTKTGNFSPGANGIAHYDQAKIRDNIYEGTAISKQQADKNVPEYLKAIYAATSEKEAIELYETQAKAYSSSLYYFLDVFGYFSAKWQNKAFADQVIQDHWYLFKDNPVGLKSLAYLYQVLGETEKAHNLYKEVFILRPNYAQSYRDLALSYADTGDYKKAAAIYARYDYLIGEGFIRAEDKYFTPLLEREFSNLLQLHGKELTGKDYSKGPSLNSDFEGTRLVFEWSDSEAEFELQFVNPQNKYFNWEHSILADPNRIKEEKIKGYSCEEYLIDGSLTGTWQVNLKYLGNKSLTPTFFKVTIYSNFGTTSQRKEVKVFKLQLKNVNQELFKVQNSMSLVSN